MENKGFFSNENNQEPFIADDQANTPAVQTSRLLKPELAESAELIINDKIQNRLFTLQTQIDAVRLQLNNGSGTNDLVMFNDLIIQKSELEELLHELEEKTKENGPEYQEKKHQYELAKGALYHIMENINGMSPDLTPEKEDELLAKLESLQAEVQKLQQHLNAIDEFPRGLGTYGVN
jgi:hypothetical protein